LSTTTEQQITDAVLAVLRATQRRTELKALCGGLTDHQLEQALLSPAGQERMQTALRAFLMEHTPAVLLTLIDPDKKETDKLAAARLFLELAGLKAAVNELLPEPPDPAGLTAAERIVVERLREVQAQRLRPSTTPHPEDTE